MTEEPIKPNPSPEQYAALQEELQKLKANNAKLLDQNIKAKEAGKAIPPDIDVNELIAFKQKKEQEELEAKGRYDEAIAKQAQQFRDAEATYKEKINAVDVPKWPELSVARVYEWAFDHDKLKQYLPDFSEYFIIFFITVISYNIDRQWLFNVIETNKPGSLSEKVD